MGKIEIKNQRMNITLIYTAKTTKYVKTGQIIFRIPAFAPDREKVGIIEEQIYNWLIAISNVLEDYDKAIAVVQGWLENVIRTDESRRVWVKMGADAAGERFVKDVKLTKKENLKKGHVITASLKGLFMNLPEC